MNGFDYYKLAFEKFGDFKSRSRRKEYWYFALFNMLVGYALLFIGGAVSQTVGFALYGIYLLLSIIPGLAVGVRRMHDIGKSGWLLLLAFIPLVGAILLIVWFATDGQKDDNNWGSSPKYGSDSISDHLVGDTV